MIIAAVILFTSGYKVSRWQEVRYGEPGGADGFVQSAQIGGGREIAVHVSGAVEKPGVYKFTGDARVLDALERAVPLERADAQSLNLAAPLKDGQKIVVPVRQDSVQAGSAAGQAAAASQGGPAVSPPGAVPGRPGRININRAGSKELEELPGVGPGLARRIIIHRESKGLFASEEDIMNVPGIGQKLYDQIRDYITVD